MNLNDQPTLEQFRELLRQHDDRAGHHVLWVRKDGEVMLACLPRSNPRGSLATYDDPDMQFRYDTFPVGYGYVGPKPPDEDEWFRGELFKHVIRQWPKLKGMPGITHLDLEEVAPEGRVVDAEEAAEIRRAREEFLRRKQAALIGSRCPADQAKGGAACRSS